MTLGSILCAGVQCNRVKRRLHHINAMKMVDGESRDPVFTERLFIHRYEVFYATWEDELELKPGAAEAVATTLDRECSAPPRART